MCKLNSYDIYYPEESSQKESEITAARWVFFYIFTLIYASMIPTAMMNPVIMLF